MPTKTKTTQIAADAATPYPEIMTEHDVARRTRRDVESVRKGRRGTGAFSTLCYLKIGRSVRYERAAVEAWIDAHRVGKVVAA